MEMLDIPKDPTTGKEVENISLVVCGNPFVGKTSMCNYYVKGYPDDTQPTEEGNIYAGFKPIYGYSKEVYVTIFDLNGEIHQPDLKARRA